MQTLVIDVGTTELRTAVVRDGATVEHAAASPLPVTSAQPGRAEFDAAALADAMLAQCRATVRAAGAVDAVALAAVRNSTVVWEPEESWPAGPALAWHDLRTAEQCRNLSREGFPLLPTQAATKAAYLLDRYDPGRTQGLLAGTIDAWLIWTLTEGALHFTDRTNAAATGLTGPDGSSWSGSLLDRLRLQQAALPLVGPSVGVVAEAISLPGAPPIAAVLGDQQASLLGLGCTRPGLAKLTLGASGSCDLWTGTRPVAAGTSDSGGGASPMVSLCRGGDVSWGVEAVLLSAGACVDWLVEVLGILADAPASHDVASACADTDGVVFVPHLIGAATPEWDPGARGAFFGLTRGTDRRHIVRAVLEGVAHAAADLLEAVEAAAETAIPSLRVDGAMATNPTLVAALADATGRPVEVSPVASASLLGAGRAAALALGAGASLDDLAQQWVPARVVEPARSGAARLADRDRWREASARAAAWLPGPAAAHR